MSRFVEHFSSHDSQPDPRAASFERQYFYPHHQQQQQQQQQQQSQQQQQQRQQDGQTDSLPELQDLHISPQSPASPQTLQAGSRSASDDTTTMSESESLAPETWIASFCSLLGHEYFAEVSEDFIEDDFNLTGLQSQVPMYKEALEMILDVEPEEDEDEEDEDEDEEEDEDMRDEHGNPIADYRRERRHVRANSDLSVIESSAELLYGLIHQRYITSRPGIQQMAEKYDQAMFGHCPRVMCNQARTLPVGMYDQPGVDTVKLFCPSCLDVYTPPNSRFQSVDGAFFGTTFGSLFFMTFSDIEVAPRGDPMRLASTHPIFGVNSGTTPTPQERANQSRSSSLTSNNIPPINTTNTVPASWLPPPDQPAVLNGVAPQNLAPGLGPGKIYEPKIYGFKVSERAKTGPRMRWLRERPVDVRELDEAADYNAADDDYSDEDEEEDDDDGAEGQEEEEEGEEEDEEGEGRGDSMHPEQFYRQDAGEAAGTTRKKAVAKSRRTGKGGDVMDTNGVGEGG